MTIVTQTAKLVLMSKRGTNGAPPAAPLTFALRGEVDARGPLKYIKTSAALYDFQELEVKLTNPFQVSALSKRTACDKNIPRCLHNPDTLLWANAILQMHMNNFF